MSTRAIQDALQLLGFRDPVTDDVLSGGTVEFYSAGTLNAKNAWEEKEKTNAVTSVTLDSSGQAQLYFDGIYKFIVKNSSGTVKYTLDDLKYQARNTSTSTKSADYISDSDDDFILADTDSGAITITLPPVATAVAPITVKNIGSSSNDVTVTGNASETIDGLASVMLADSTSQQYVTDGVQWYGAGIATGTDYTSTTLVSGTNNSFDVASGITSVNVPDSSNTVKGAIEIATDAEAVTGTAELLAVNPKQLKVVADSVDAVSDGRAKAWGNFNGIGTVALIKGYNVAAVADGGVGLYNVTFTNNMSDANYVVIAVTADATEAVTNIQAVSINKAVGGFTIEVEANTGTQVDAAFVDFVVFGTLA